MVQPDFSVAFSEILEQPDLLARLRDTRDAWARPFVDLCREHDFKRVLFVGNGSPYYVGRTLRYATERLLGGNVDPVMAGEFAFHGLFDCTGGLDPGEVLLVCPAETGHSRGQVDAARRARHTGVPVVCTTLNPHGVLARECDVVLAKLGSCERSIAATKNQTMALYMLLSCLVEAGHVLGSLGDGEYARALLALDSVPDNVRETISISRDWYLRNRERLLSAPGFFLVGYGANYGTCLEGTLKFVECHERPTQAVQLEETLHGPLRSLHRDDVMLLLSTEAGCERDRMTLLSRQLPRYCDNIVIIDSLFQGEIPGVPIDNTLSISSSDFPDVCSIEYLVPLQVIAVLLAQDIGIDLTVPKVPELDPVMLPAYED